MVNVTGAKGRHSFANPSHSSLGISIVKSSRSADGIDRPSLTVVRLRQVIHTSLFGWRSAEKVVVVKMFIVPGVDIEETLESSQAAMAPSELSVAGLLALLVSSSLPVERKS